VIREASKPLEAIDSIKIVQVDGITGRGGAAGAAESGGEGDRNLANSAVAAALRYRAQAPVIDGLMRELGFDGGTLDGLVAGAAEMGAKGIAAAPSDDDDDAPAPPSGASSRKARSGS